MPCEAEPLITAPQCARVGPVTKLPGAIAKRNKRRSESQPAPPFRCVLSKLRLGKAGLFEPPGQNLCASKRIKFPSLSRPVRGKKRNKVSTWKVVYCCLLAARAAAAEAATDVLELGIASPSHCWYVPWREGDRRRAAEILGHRKRRGQVQAQCAKRL